MTMTSPLLGSVTAIMAAGEDESYNSPEKLEDVAAEFEALLIGQLLASTRNEGGAGWLGTGEDEAGGLMVELAEQELARTLASNGGTGIAKLVVEGLTTGEGKLEIRIPADMVNTDEQETTQTG